MYVSPHYGGLERPINSSTSFHRTLEANILTMPPAYYFQPLLHAIIFLIEMVIAARLAAKFNSYYAERPGKMTARL